MDELELPDDPDDALEAIRARDGVVVVLKRSPTCPTSHRAEYEWRSWQRAGTAAPGPVHVATVDVLDRRGLARGLTERLGVRHESPQLLVLVAGELRSHASHAAITRETIEDAVRSPE